MRLFKYAALAAVLSVCVYLSTALPTVQAQAQFSVTPGDTITWDPISGAHYDVILLDTNPGSLLTPPGTIDTGASNEVTVAALLGTRAAGTYYIRVRSKNPDGTLPSAYSPAVEFTYAGFPVPTGISKKP